MRARHATLPGDEIDMHFNPKTHHRYSIRLKGYNYSQEGAYFITICVQQKKCLFGTIKNAKIQLNNLGKVVAEEWRKTLDLRDYLKLDAWVVMPNHFHGIIQIEKEAPLKKKPSQVIKILRNLENLFRDRFQVSFDPLNLQSQSVLMKLDKHPAGNYGNEIIGNMSFVTKLN